METIKRICLYVAGSLFRFVIFFGISLVCLSLLIGHPKNVKNQIAEGDTYEQFTQGLIDDTIKNNPNSTVPLTDPKLQEIIKQSFPPESLQKNTELVIDSAYDWLQEKTPSPQFNVDFTTERQQLANNIAGYAFTRLKAQPTCFAVPEQIDPFTAGCVPPYQDISAEQVKFSESIASPEGLLPKVTYASADLPKDVNGKYIYQRYAYVPKLYKWLVYSPIIVGTLFITLAATIVMLNRNKRQGFQQLGYATIGSGVALIVTPLFISYIIPHFAKSLAFQSTTTTGAQGVISDVIARFSTNFNILLINAAIQCIGLGLLILTLEKLSRPRTKYSNLVKSTGLVSSVSKKPSSANKRYKPDTIPLQSSEESVRRKPRRTKNRKYRKIPKKEM